MKDEQIAALENELLRLRLENEALKDEIEILKRRFFGRSSEKTAEDIQPVLFDEPASSSPEGSEPPATPVAAHTRKNTGRKPLSKDLERQEILIDIPDEDKHCACGHELSRIG